MVFSIPSYLCTGDRPRRAVDERAKGATFLVGRSKSGHNPDALIDKQFHYMWNGDRTVDPTTRQHREQKESNKHNLTNNGFAYTGPTQKGEGLGSYFGCFQQIPYEHMAQHPYEHSAHIQHKTIPARGIYTSPAQKGSGYGYANLALSKLGANYMHSFYDQQRRNDQTDKQRLRAKMPGEPFKPVGRRGYTFDESLATGASRCYMMTVPFTEKKPLPELKHYSVPQVWRPAGFVEDRPTAMEYWQDPYGGYDPRVQPKVKLPKITREVFKPTSRGDNFWYTQSVVFKRL